MSPATPTGGFRSGSPEYRSSSSDLAAGSATMQGSRVSLDREAGRLARVIGPPDHPGPRIERLLEPALGASLVVERRDLADPSLFGQDAERHLRKLEVRRSAAGSADGAADSS
jgi:hypothetical protein